MPKIMVAITENMVKEGLKTLEEFLQEPEEGDDGASDVQFVVEIFTRMWRTKCAEEQALKGGKMPKIIRPKTNSLIMPGSGMA